jgi:hypothetical protein
MTERRDDLSLRSLILVPAVITLAVTLLRLVGELLRWDPSFFSRLPKWFWIGLLPQLTLWIAFTVIIGGFVGGLTAAAVGRRAAPAVLSPAR